MAKQNEPKIGVGTELSQTRKRSERIQKRKLRLAPSPDGVPKIKIKKKTLPKSSTSNETPIAKKGSGVITEQKNCKVSLDPAKNTNEPVQVKKRNKKNATTFEIDCTPIDMDATNLRKDLWHRAKNGKINSIQNIRIKQKGKIVYITARCYVPKKCIRSNLHFLIEAYLKQKKIDRPVHLVGDKNVYKLVYK